MTLLLISMLASPPEVWVGHQVVRGSRDIPVLGKVETRTDSYVLAKVTRQDSGEIFLEQKACDVDVAETMGVKVTMSKRAIDQMPLATIRMVPEGEGVYRAQPWVVGWGTRDLDSDGKPGVTVNVDSTLCGGDLHVASSVSSAAEGKLTADGFVGWISVDVKQTILGSSGWCLSKAASDVSETQLGKVAYQRVDPSTTCRDFGSKRVSARLSALLR